MTAARRYRNQIASARLVADVSALVPPAPMPRVSDDLLHTSSDDVSTIEKRSDA